MAINKHTADLKPGAPLANLPPEGFCKEWFCWHDYLSTFASGALFGAAITAAGVYSPAVIIGQMNFTDFHMLKTFLAASASSAIAIVIVRRFQLARNPTPRSASSINLFSTYDGNVLGGLLLGAGMTLTGACPGTVLPQVVTGVRSGPLVLLGGVLGGTVWSKYRQSGDYLDRNLRVALNTGRKEKKAGFKAPLTVDEKVGISERSAVLGYELICLSILATATYFTPGKGEVLVPAIVGGLLIGGSQFASLIISGKLLGVSAAYEQIGDLFWFGGKILRGSHQTSTPPKAEAKHIPAMTSAAFAVGTMLGSLVLSRVVSIPTSPNVDISALRAVTGGAIMLFGSRLAGGCTSGHGISGMSMLSISSFISVASMFAGGMGLAAILGLLIAKFDA